MTDSVTERARQIKLAPLAASAWKISPAAIFRRACERSAMKVTKPLGPTEEIRPQDTNLLVSRQILDTPCLGGTLLAKDLPIVPVHASLSPTSSLGASWSFASQIPRSGDVNVAIMAAEESGFWASCPKTWKPWKCRADPSPVQRVICHAPIIRPTLSDRRL